MSPAVWFVLAVAPGFALFVAGALTQIVRAARGGSNRAPYQAMALGTALILLGSAFWLLVAAPQPIAVKLLAVPAPLLLSIPFLLRARRPPKSIDAC
jgi:hypothetical protein